LTTFALVHGSWFWERVTGPLPAGHFSTITHPERLADALAQLAGE